MTIQEMQEKAWGNAEEKGFHSNRTDSRDDTLLRLCLIHTEVSEAAQEVKRYGTDQQEVRDRIGAELADIIIRVGDLAGCLNLDLQTVTVAKLAQNRPRPRLYGTPAQHTGGV